VGVGVALGTGILAMVMVKLRLRNIKSWGVHNAEDEIDIKGKIVVITGGSSGLGKETAAQLVKRGATVVLPCRDHITGLNTVEGIKKMTDTSKGKMVLPGSSCDISPILYVSTSTLYLFRFRWLWILLP
jgi:glycine/D-amino acid oxidase-like deaminating enzyme